MRTAGEEWLPRFFPWETYGIIPKAAVAKQAIPRCNLTYVDGQDMMKQIKGYFDVLFAAKPASIGVLRVSRM